MPEEISKQPKKTLSPDWFVQGILTRLGEMFDKFTGRNWKPSSSLATSELIERMNKLLDAEARDTGTKGTFVPHIVRLKMQWNKFSTESEDALKPHENELLTAAVDHINDKRYHTYAPLDIEVKPDYFTEGVRLTASFGDQEADEDEAAIKVTMPEMKRENLMVVDLDPAEKKAEPKIENYAAEFTLNGKAKTVNLKFAEGSRLSVGRTKENALMIEDASVSKIHATLFVNQEGKLLVADTGSTNGTYLNGERLAYGRAYEVGENDNLKFGDAEVFLRRVPEETNFVTREDLTADADSKTEQYSEGDFKTNKDFQNADEFAQTSKNIVNVEPRGE